MESEAHVSGGPSFSCPENNSGIFWRAVRTGKYFRPDAINGRPDAEFTELFLSFPTTHISSQSDIWVKSYDQNTRGCPHGLTERPDGQLQPPFQSCTESFHIRPRLDGDALSSGRLHFGCTSLPYKGFEGPDPKGWRSDGWTGARNFHIWSLIVRTMKADV